MELDSLIEMKSIKKFQNPMEMFLGIRSFIPGARFINLPSLAFFLHYIALEQ